MARPAIALVLLGFRYLAEFRVRAEPVAIGHLDLRQAVLVELAFPGKDPVQAQNIGGHRIGIVDTE
jgi:hypothetical protein